MEKEKLFDFLSKRIDAHKAALNERYDVATEARLSECEKVMVFLNSI